MLKKFAECGDKRSKRVLKDEIIFQLGCNFKPTIEYLHEEGFVSSRYFTREELEQLLPLIPEDLKIEIVMLK